MYANPKDIRNERINLSLNDAEFEAVKKLANEFGLQPSALAREVVLEFLKNGNSPSKLQPIGKGAEPYRR